MSANATSYIPTLASAVTRNADVISQTGISDLIGQTEGTLYVEVNIGEIESKGILSILVDSGNFYRIRTSTANSILFRYRTASGTETTIPLINTNNLATGTYKIAFAYKDGDYASCVNGVLRTSSITGISPIGTFSQITLGLEPTSLNDTINLASLWKTRLTNEQLIQLTTI
jgi:hypothetical protein